MPAARQGAGWRCAACLLATAVLDAGPGVALPAAGHLRLAAGRCSRRLVIETANTTAMNDQKRLTVLCQQHQTVPSISLRQHKRCWRSGIKHGFRKACCYGVYSYRWDNYSPKLEFLGNSNFIYKGKYFVKGGCCRSTSSQIPQPWRKTLNFTCCSPSRLQRGHCRFLVYLRFSSHARTRNNTLLA